MTLTHVRDVQQDIQSPCTVDTKVYSNDREHQKKNKKKIIMPFMMKRKLYFMEKM